MFELHPRLATDCLVVGDLPLCRVLLMNDNQYPWLILVPRQPGLRELHELSREDQHQYLEESNLSARLLEQLFSAEKLNIAALGNMVPQLHIHHIARFKSDAAWPGPVWGVHPAQSYAELDLRQHLADLRSGFCQREPRFHPAVDD